MSCKERHFIQPSLKVALSMSIWLKSLQISISQYSKTRKTLSLLCPTTTSFKVTIFGCSLSCRRILTYLKEVIGKPPWVSSTFIFLMAYCQPVLLSRAKNTIPQVPSPIMSPFQNSPIKRQFSKFILSQLQINSYKIFIDASSNILITFPQRNLLIKLKLMSKKGFLKIRLYSVESSRIDNKKSVVKVKSADAQASILVSNNEEHYHLLPVSQILQLSILGDNSALGYFELPLKKLYQYPFKKHLVTVNCVTKDAHDGSVLADVFGIVKLSIEYLQNQVAKFDVLIQNVTITSDKAEVGGKQLYVECTVGNVSSQTTVKKSKGGQYVWNEILPFTLQAIPGKVDFVIKDKDMVNDQIIGKAVIDPQAQNILNFKGKVKEGQCKIENEEQKVVLKFTTTFKLQEQ